MSGLLFSLAFDPFVREFARRVDDAGLGVSRMCADDVGIAFRHVHGLLAAAHVFDSAEDFASMFLNFSKCILVPLSLRLPATLAQDPRGSRMITNDAQREDVHRWLREWLLLHLSRWSGFQIASAAEYLGVWLGPVSAQLRWRSAIEKWFTRGVTIAAAGAPPLTSAKLYEQRSLSCLNFLAQFFWLPDVKIQEKRLLSKIMKVPFTLVTVQNAVNMGSWGGISWRSVWATCLATMVRAALSTFTTWDHCCQLLLAASSLDSSWMPFAQVRLHSYQPAGWDTCSIAATLAEASKGFPRCAALRTFLPKIIGDSRLAVQQFALESPGKRFKLQQYLYANVVKIIFPDNVEVALCHRSRRFSDPGLSPGSLDIYRTLLNDLPKAIAQQALPACCPQWLVHFLSN